jgi:hypothetical protein
MTTKDFAVGIGNAIIDYVEDNEIKLTEKDLNDFFTGMLVAYGSIYETVTGEGNDLIGVSHIMNRLAIQFIMENTLKAQDEPEESNG